MYACSIKPVSYSPSTTTSRFGQSFLDIAANHPASDQHIIFAVGVDACGIGGERGRNRGQRGKLFPGNGKVCEIESFDSLGIADDGGDCFTSEPGFGFGKYRLVGKTRNHAVAVLSRDIFCGKNAKDSRMCRHESVKIAETEACPLVGTSDGSDDERAGRNFVGAKNLRAIDFALAVEPHQPSCPPRCPAWGDGSATVAAAASCTAVMILR